MERTDSEVHLFSHQAITAVYDWWIVTIRCQWLVEIDLLTLLNLATESVEDQIYTVMPEPEIKQEITIPKSSRLFTKPLLHPIKC